MDVKRRLDSRSGKKYFFKVQQYLRKMVKDWDTTLKLPPNGTEEIDHSMKLESIRNDSYNNTCGNSD